MASAYTGVPSRVVACTWHGTARSGRVTFSEYQRAICTQSRFLVSTGKSPCAASTQPDSASLQASPAVLTAG